VPSRLCLTVGSGQIIPMFIDCVCRCSAVPALPPCGKSGQGRHSQRHSSCGPGRAAGGTPLALACPLRAAGKPASSLCSLPCRAALPLRAAFTCPARPLPRPGGHCYACPNPRPPLPRFSCALIMEWVVCFGVGSGPA
jgi:hypothetical protein